MFETDLADLAVADLVLGAVDEAGDSTRRWALLLGTVLVGLLAFLWFARRAATDDDVVHVPDAGGPG